MDRFLQLGIAALIPILMVGSVLLGERLLHGFPVRGQAFARPWLWLAPALLFIGLFLVYPALHTIALSLRSADSSSWVGLANYQSLAMDPGVLQAARNTLIWVVVFTGAAVLLGLGIAILADRVTYEGAVTASVFLPMATSFVAAGVIWRFMYAYRPPPLEQTGTVNAFLGLIVPGFEPQAWLVNNPPLNTLALVAAAVWIWAGFCTVVLSATLKGIPSELLEAARVDGANEVQIYWRIIVPMLGPTLGVLATTMMIFALKAFDIVYVMTSGNYETDVIANRMYKEMFNVHDFGRASALAVVLLTAIVPVILLNLRRFGREQDRTA
jgi:alpha-glucoside transport system permease protein